VAEEGDMEWFIEWVNHACSRTQMRAIVSRMVLHSYSRLERHELVHIMIRYFAQFTTEIFSESRTVAEYEGQPEYIVRAINFGRVAFIRMILSRHSSEYMRDLYLTNPAEEMRCFPDLWLNDYKYKTPLTKQFLLPRPQYVPDISAQPAPSPSRKIIFRLILSDSHSEESDDCCICYDTILPEKQVSFDCRHKYCGKCAIEVYKKHHQSCAICREKTNSIFFQTEEELYLCQTDLLERGGIISDTLL
jgi:hypothetical protein